MKTALIALSSLLILSTTAMAADVCRAKALLAAEDYYGNDPQGTSVRAVRAGVRYEVSVGRGNVEDGEHFYNVTFPYGCNGKAVVKEIQD